MYLNLGGNKKRGCYHSYCIPCHDENLRASYIKHKSDNYALVKKRGQDIRDHWSSIINKAKNVPCLDCGILYPSYVMDFDHREPAKKKLLQLLR